MLTNSLLFHAFGIYRYQLKNTKYQEGKVYFHIEHDRASLRCPICDSSSIIKRGYQTKTFKTVPIGLKPVFIVLKHQRVFCSDCQNIRYVKLDFADSQKSYTRKFEQPAVELPKHSTIQDVAGILKTGWDLIKRIDKESLKKYDKPKLKDVKRIAIDEISIGKGHKYLTLKEDLRQMWFQPSKADAEYFIMSWIAKAEQSGIRMLKRFAKTIRKHFRSILNHYDYLISTNIIEGLNNKIKTLHKQSYVFRDVEFFKLKIKAIHRAKYQLCG